VFDDDSSNFGGIDDLERYGGITIGDSSGLDSHDRYGGWRAEEKRQKRLADNPLAALKDDYQLRCWCDSSIARFRELERDSDAPKPKVRWSRAVVSWEVSKGVDGESDLEESSRRMRGRGKGIAKVALPLSLRPTSLTAPTTPPTSPPAGSDDDLLSSPPSSSSLPALDASSHSSSSDDESDDPDATDLDDSPSLSLRRYSSPDFFYCEDLVGEGFLPPRLPKDVVTFRKDRGRGMERQRKALHEKLNEVAGVRRLFPFPLLQRYLPSSPPS
jgi:hypothetical protein